MNWVVQVAESTDPPKVFSISYGIPEHYLTFYEIFVFDTEIKKLGLQGVTVLAASGTFVLLIFFICTLSIYYYHSTLCCLISYSLLMSRHLLFFLLCSDRVFQVIRVLLVTRLIPQNAVRTVRAAVCTVRVATNVFTVIALNCHYSLLPFF
jgi:hypothetical protein